MSKNLKLEFEIYDRNNPAVWDLFLRFTGQAIAAEWTDTAPTKAGRYLWRKDRKWEPVYRDLVLRSDGRLYTYSERFLNWVPLSHIEAGGSQWHLEPSGDFSQK